MTRIGTVANAIGLQERDGERGVLMAMVDGRPRHAYLGNALELEIDDVGDALYVAAGLFRDGSLQGNTGRSTENLTRVLWLAFDADLLDFLGYPPDTDDESKAARKAMLDELGRMPQDELNTLIDGLRADLEDAFRALGLPMHRLDYTGYGLCAYIYLAEDDQTRVLDAKAAHKLLVGRINQHAGGEHLVDPKVNDGGTRVTRLPESTNHKGAIPRLVQSLIPYTGETAPLGVNPEVPRAVGKMIPTSGLGLSQPDAQAIVDAIRPSWTLGQKHAMGLAVAGMLAKGGVPEDQALAIIDALSVDDTKPYDRRAAVASTYRRARQGAPIAGYTQLASLMPAAAVAFVDGVLGRYRQAASTASGPVSVGMFEVVGASPLRLARDEPATLPRNLSAVPDACYTGWFKSYVDLVEPLCESPRSFHLASAMVLAGATFGRSVCARYVSRNVYGNTYMMLVGLAGSSRKDTAIDFALDMPNHRGPGYSSLDMNSPAFKVVTDIGSGQAMIQKLSRTPNVLLHVTEYQRVAQNGKREGSTIFPLLTTAWNTPRIVENNALGNPLEARFPYLSILAAVQPGILAQEMRQVDIESGYATRWLFVTGDGKDEDIPDPDEIDETTAWRLYRDLVQIRQRYEIEGESTGREKRLMLTQRARDHWNDWYREDRRVSRLTANEDEASMRSRLGTHIRKVALLYAATAGASEIDLGHLEPAIAFVEWSWCNTQVLMRDWGVSVWLQIENKIEKVLREHGAIMRRDLAHKCRSRLWSSREFAQVLDAMIKNGTVEVDAIGIHKWAA